MERQRNPGITSDAGSIARLREAECIRRPLG
jgi:hypothetical protein